MTNCIRKLFDWFWVTEGFPIQTKSKEEFLAEAMKHPKGEVWVSIVWPCGQPRSGMRICASMVTPAKRVILLELPASQLLPNNGEVEANARILAAFLRWHEFTVHVQDANGRTID